MLRLIYTSLTPRTATARRCAHTMSRPNTFVHLHTLDLRVHDSPSLHLSHSPSSDLSSKITHFLPVYIFDPRQLDLTRLPNAPSIPAPRKESSVGKPQDGDLPPNPNYRDGRQKTRASPRSRVAGFHRTSPHRLAFLLEAVFGLRESYRQSGGDMLIGYGRPEIILPSLLDSLGNTSDIAGVWAQEEITVEEANVLSSLRQALGNKHNKIELHTNDSKTMIPTKHLPFDPKDTPDVYTTFRKQVEGLGLSMGEGMLVEPLKTASWDEGNQAIKVSVEGRDLKPFPDLPNPEMGQGQGGWLGPKDDANSIEGMYTALSAPLFDSPPIGGWSSAANSPSSLPARHHHTAVPFGGSESSALARLDDYVGRPNSDSGRWSGGSKARTYKSTRNGLLGDGFSTKFASFLSLGTLSAREAGWRVGLMLESSLGRNKEVWNNVYCA